jgi:16S rRNA (cytosine967-C5)-methyltransferase
MEKLMPSARMAAAQVLLAIDARRETLATEIDRARRGVTDERDRALLLELASGVVRWRAELDALLAPCTTRPLSEIDPAILVVLRLGAYQLRHLDRIPPHAIVHEAVGLVREIGHARAAGLVNAVLRTLDRRRGRPDLPVRPPDGSDQAAWVRYLSTTLSHPAWLVARWIARHGPDAAERWCAFNNEPPVVTVRAIDPTDAADLERRFADAGVAATPARFVRGAWRLPAGALGQLPPGLRERVAVQDEASQVVAHAVGARPGESVLDLCAAPGGKSIVIAGDMAGRGRLVSCDSRPRRLRLLRAALGRAARMPCIVRLDANQPLPFAARFDRVLVDVPCSGLGTLARDPDIKWRREPADLPRLAKGELRMLTMAADAVRPGGRLVYATCSGEPEETDEIVDAFLQARPDFARLPGTDLEACPALEHTEALLDARGDVRTWPFAHRLDAFFAARLVRREGT